MKTWFLLFSIFLSTLCKAQSYVKHNEELILSFQTINGKQLYLVKDRAENYIVYRYGTKDSVEFEYPNKLANSLEKFTYSYYLRGGGKENEGLDLNYLYFENAGYQYVVYHTFSAVDEKKAIGIKVTNLKTNKTVNIKGDPKTQKGTLIDFRDNGLLEIGDEIFD